jgi:hypothetical protein
LTRSGALPRARAMFSGKLDGASTMNWRRGLFRAWVVFATCWAGVVGGYGLYNWYNDPWRVVSVKDIKDIKCDPANPLTQLVPACAKATVDPAKTMADPNYPPWLRGPDVPRQLILSEAFWLAVGPPALLLAFGAALYWVASGFRV